MGHGIPRTGLTGSSHGGWGSTALAGRLAQLALVDGPAVPPSLADGLGRWLGWADAIPLSAALQQPLDAAPRPPAVLARLAAEGQQAFADVQARVQQAIQDDEPAATAPARRLRGRQQAPQSPQAPTPDDDFSPHRQRCGRLQQAMDAEVGALRQRLRGLASQGVPVQQRLAAIDAVMAQVLAPREQSLLAQMPTLLQTQFDRLRRAAPASAPDPDGSTPAAPAAWLVDFRHHMRQLLLAELDLRLLPARALLDALCAH